MEIYMSFKHKFLHIYKMFQEKNIKRTTYSFLQYLYAFKTL